jgi:hypothetical protein
MKRAANAQRRERFLNARKRIMGIDVLALDQQVAEKRVIADTQREADLVERVRQLEIDRILEETKQEEADMKKYLNEDVKKSWDDAVRFKENKYVEPDLDPANAGVSAAQTFAGADPYRKDRIRSQKEQMRKWVNEQVREKSANAKAKKEEELYFAELTNTIVNIQEEADAEEKAMTKYLNDTVRDENIRAAQEKAQRKAAMIMADKNLPMSERLAATSINLRDNEDLAMDETGRIVRKDQFRGYTQAQTRRIIAENEAFLEAKRAIASTEGDNDAAYAAQQLVQQQAMERANHEEQLLRNKETMMNLDVIMQQKALQESRRKQSTTDRFGTIEDGFFNKFGMDCR